MPADAERDPIEWAQHSALVAISVARTVLDLVEAAVTDRERLERLATSGRSFAESWLGDVVRTATTMASGFGFEPTPPPASPPSPAASRPATDTVAAKKTASKGAPVTQKAPAKPKAPAKKARAAPKKRSAPREKRPVAKKAPARPAKRRR